MDKLFFQIIGISSFSFGVAFVASHYLNRILEELEIPKYHFLITAFVFLGVQQMFILQTSLQQKQLMEFKYEYSEAEDESISEYEPSESESDELTKLTKNAYACE